MRNTYYLVLGQLDAYITETWFRNKKYAEMYAEEVRGKELLISEIQVVGEIINVDFWDGEYQAQEILEKVTKHPDFQDHWVKYLGLSDDLDKFVIYDEGEELFSSSVVEEIIDYFKARLVQR